MSRIPDFSARPLDKDQSAAAPAFSAEPWITPEGIAVKSVYGPEDVEGLPAVDSFPGYRRLCAGPPHDVRNRPWTIRQYAGFSTAEIPTPFIAEISPAGQKVLSVAFDLPTHRGYDSDHPRVGGDVGKAGVAIDSARRHENPLRRHPAR